MRTILFLLYLEPLFIISSMSSMTTVLAPNHQAFA
jgi:hypothetical protein